MQHKNNNDVTPLSRRRVLSGAACLAVSALLASSTGALAKPPRTPKPQVIMDIAQKGKITIELDPQAAPKTVAHFLDLVNQKFYDGILFHRFEPDFVIQGGDPNTKKVKQSDLQGPNAEQVKAENALGTGGSGKTVPLEAKLTHDRGTVGLARSQEEDSGDSQFFFNLKADGNHFLDYKYCVFGKVTKGMNIVDKLRVGDKITSVRLVPAKAKK